MNRLANKSAVVTGGSRGIGRAIVERFCEEGADVLACGRGARPADLDERVYWVRCDVSDTRSVQSLRDQSRSQFENVDILVNNAGIQIEKTVTNTTDQDWDQLMGINARGVFVCCREFIPVMSAGGSIINIGSIAGNIADHGLGLYNASKAFVHGLTRSIAVDHGPAVRCNAISPGWIMTEMADVAFDTAGNPGAARADALARHPVGRFGQPEDVASLAVWLGSDESSFASGQCYTLDGGLTAGSQLNPGLF
jgi:NAD(P)-dependent dehydrogenase (short-subunit alcohol dehydrogenase family)